MNEKNWKIWAGDVACAVTSRTVTQPELRDTQLEEWEEVLPSPPMLPDVSEERPDEERSFMDFELSSGTERD